MTGAALDASARACTSIRATQGKGVMPDGTSRFSLGGQPVHHYMGCSTFSNFTVLPEIAVAKVNPVTALLNGARSLMAGEPTGILAAYLVAFGLISLVGMPAQNPMIAMTFWVFAYWYSRLAGVAATPMPMARCMPRPAGSIPATPAPTTPA